MRFNKGMFGAVAAVVVFGMGCLVYAAEVALGPKDGDGLTPTDLERVKVGDLAPDFTLEDEKSTPMTLSQCRGTQKVVLVFYRGHW